MAEKEWSESPEDDPVELQKRQLALGKKFLDKMEAQEAKDKEREAALPVYGTVTTYSPPTFEQTSERVKKAWDEVERIVPRAPDAVKAQAFQALMNTSQFFGGVA